MVSKQLSEITMASFIIFKKFKQNLEISIYYFL